MRDLDGHDIQRVLKDDTARDALLAQGYTQVREWQRGNQTWVELRSPTKEA